MKKLGFLGKIALLLTIIGALNWGLVGILNFNLVSFLFHTIPVVERVVYIVVGLSGLYLCFALAGGGSKPA